MMNSIGLITVYDYMDKGKVNQKRLLLDSKERPNHANDTTHPSMQKYNYNVMTSTGPLKGGKSEIKKST